MNYKNAKDILPPDLLKQVQKYVHGEQMYIPMRESVKRKWGHHSGAREEITFRNKAIFEKYHQGTTMEELSELFCLSLESIRKIIYKSKRENERNT